MTQQKIVHIDKRVNRVHFIPEWAEKRGFKQAGVCRALGVDKSTVSRWFAGTVPTEQHLTQLAELFQTEISSLFRDPDDDWLARLFRNRSEEEKREAAQMLEIWFKRGRTGTDG